MEFRILGPLQALSDGAPVDLGPHKQRSLLAFLLLSANRVVSTDRILEELWGEESAGKEKALWVHVSRLRSALEPARAERGESSVLLTRDHGYLLQIAPDALDAHRFEAAVAEGRALLRDDPAAASVVLEDALAMWRGPALAEFTYDDFARAEISRLEELRLDAAEHRIDADLRRGKAGELVGELERLVEEHPFRERTVSQLMLALYRAGRQADALRTFQRFRRRLDDELGLEPSPELRRLEEQILLHDSRLQVPTNAAAMPTTAVRYNPFKGLHSFREADAEDFFGRDRLVAEVVGRIAAGARLVTLVGASGSGKSSVVRAGVLPALRKGSVPGSADWTFASMVPGSHPFAELEAALLRSTLDAPDTLDAQLQDGPTGLLRAALCVLPDETSRLLLVVDQFEELFLLVGDEEVRRRFLANIVTAIDDAHGRLTIVLTLRADCYHHPLDHAEFAALLGSSIVNVVALAPDEFEAAAEGPAARRGTTLEPALVAELLTDVIGEPGALPIFQYALTELFDQRDGDVLTVAAYRAMGGVRGALSRRADDVYDALSADQRAASRQLFLRLVTIGEHDDWGRRRVPAAELISMDLDTVTMEAVISRFGQHRFLAFDRDLVTGAPTVEVAHEALLREWALLCGWIETGRHDVKRNASLRSAMSEWEQSGRDDDYLLTGNRLTEYDRWSRETSMRLTTLERDYLDAALASERARATQEARLHRRARGGLWGLAAATAALALLITGILLARSGPEPKVALLRAQGYIGDLLADGLQQANREFDIEAEELETPYTDVSREVGHLANTGTELIIVSSQIDLMSLVEDIAPQSPDTTFAYVDVTVPGAPSFEFAEHEGSYLVGAAAALTSQTGTIGFIGGFQYTLLERFRSGFEAGAAAVDPDIEILSSYLAVDASGWGRPDLATTVATDMYHAGADVIFHAAGESGSGVFAAARTESEALGRHLWTIGVDADAYLGVSALERPHVLTSMIKKFDVAVHEIVRTYLAGELAPVRRELTLADGAVDYSTTGGHLSAEVVAELEQFREEIIAGTREVPRSPSGSLASPPGVSTAARTVTITFDGSTCTLDGPATFTPNSAVRIEFVNTTETDAVASVRWGDEYIGEVPAGPAGSNVGFVELTSPGPHPVECGPEFGEAIVGPTLAWSSD
jgi:basic membrane lipoprotein Med (substrate-binding protein (PBP1-ABC) superfamily)/DNA-binding SARP family transcriptional activator